jgi:hypothetical protein
MEFLKMFSLVQTKNNTFYLIVIRTETKSAWWIYFRINLIQRVIFMDTMPHNYILWIHGWHYAYNDYNVTAIRMHIANFDQMMDKDYLHIGQIIYILQIHLYSDIKGTPINIAINYIGTSINFKFQLWSKRIAFHTPERMEKKWGINP